MCISTGKIVLLITTQAAFKVNMAAAESLRVDSTAWLWKPRSTDNEARKKIRGATKVAYSNPVKLLTHTQICTIIKKTHSRLKLLL